MQYDNELSEALAGVRQTHAAEVEVIMADLADKVAAEVTTVKQEYAQVIADKDRQLAQLKTGKDSLRVCVCVCVCVLTWNVTCSYVIELTILKISSRRLTLWSYLSGSSTGCLRVLPALRPFYQTSGSGGYQHYGISIIYGRLNCFDTANFYIMMQMLFLEKMIACLFELNVTYIWGHIATVTTYSSGTLTKCWENEQLLFLISYS